MQEHDGVLHSYPESGGLTVVGVVGDGSDAAVSRHRRRRRRPQIVFFDFFVLFSSPTLSFTLLNLKNLKKYIYSPKSKVQKKYYLLKASF
jgi:hypothetical protein